MRLGVLDVGSNTVHLLVVDAHRGAHPWPLHSEKEALRLAERLDGDGNIEATAVDELIRAIDKAQRSAQNMGTEGLITLATSAVRDATNGEEVLARVHNETGVELQVLAGDDEARLTFLAVRRWFGWSAGKLLVLDIGGGSLEVAAGVDELPEIALSMPLGAGRLTRDWLREDPPTSKSVESLTDYVTESLNDAAARVAKLGPFDRVAATSKTFRTLARLSGAAPSAAGLRAPRSLTLTGLHQTLGFVRRLPASALAELDGVSPRRAHQLMAGAIVAETAMWRLGVRELDICPWALREGVILRYLDQLAS
ncbi:Ppx/GppA phosphatase family protein [Phytomonospora sp. NPDC050363]|uniref:Ppx/GppA phosphatase family protein n=1 Tax=Phytomonospora sp. NPDC050363 TaxID=3155642 RepID=UPI0033C200DD